LYKLVGNAVSVPVVRLIATDLFLYLKIIIINKKTKLFYIIKFKSKL
jgi:hypothetical protein